MAEPSPMGYQPGLDGLRALSVTLVILYHAGVVGAAEAAGTDPRWFFDGGFLGVEVFFVVSGYLITSLLLEERARAGRIDLVHFWFRRFRRLLPALWVMITACGVWATFWGQDYLADLRLDAVFGLAYLANFQQLFGEVSYFGGVPRLLRHLWSLAVEEHFYLLFPPVFALVLRRSSTAARRLLWVVVPAAVASSLAFALVWASPVDRLTDAGAVLDDTRQNWAYLSTFTRMGGILIGVALALVWSPWHHLPARSARSARSARRLDLAGVGAAAGIVVACFLSTTESPALYRGGLTAVSLLAAVAIAAAVHPDTRVMHAMFAHPAIAAVGRRSYGLYLWHWPIFVGPLAGRTLWERLVFGGAATAVASELCYRYVETPIRRGALGQWLAARHASSGPSRRRFVLTGVAVVAGFGLLAGSLVVRLATADRTGPVAEAAAGAGVGPVEAFDVDAALGELATATTAAVQAMTLAPTASGTRPELSSPPVSVSTSSTAPGPVLLKAPPIPNPATPPSMPRRVVIVGDSMAHSLFHNLPAGLGETFAMTNGAVSGCGVVEEGEMDTELRSFRSRFERCRGWKDRWAKKAHGAQAEVALVVLGAWDVFDLELPTRRLTFGTEAWDAYWSSRLRGGIAALKEIGAQVALLEVGCMRPQNVKGQGVPALPERGDDVRVAHLNQLLIREAIADPEHVFFVPGPPEWCADETISQDLLYRWDGVHPARKGGKLILESIAFDLLSIPPPPATRPGPPDPSTGLRAQVRPDGRPLLAGSRPG